MSQPAGADSPDYHYTVLTWFESMGLNLVCRQTVTRMWGKWVEGHSDGTTGDEDIIAYYDSGGGKMRTEYRSFESIAQIVNSHHGKNYLANPILKKLKAQIGFDASYNQPLAGHPLRRGSQIRPPEK
jgi:hypothetical protein